MKLGEKFNLNLNGDKEEIQKYGKNKKVVKEYQQPF